MVVGVGHQDPVGTGHGDVVGMLQLTKLGPEGSELANERAIGLEYLVGDINCLGVVK